MDISTIHSHCFRHLGLSKEQTVDDKKLEEFLPEFGLDFEDGGDGKLYIEIMSRARSKERSIMEEYEDSNRPGSFAHFEAFVASYNQWKDAYGYVDFADMLDRYPKAPADTSYTHLLVDECQDLTPAHWKVINHMMTARPGMRVVIAGDDDQTLFTYAGADPHGAEKFADRWGAKRDILKQSHRVPKATHELARVVINRVETRVKKAYRPAAREGRVEYWGDPLFIEPEAGRDTLILYSDRYAREPVEEALRERHVPYLALNGMPAPMQTKAGQAVRLAYSDSYDKDPNKLRRLLNERGRQLLDARGVDVVLSMLRAGDVGRVAPVHWSHADYLAQVHWNDGLQPVKISTIHGAKGMEAKDVHLVNSMSPAAIEHSFRDPDAQHRLYYVAVTRAEENLYIYEGQSPYDFAS